jgi:hypothetical protein
VDSRRNALPDGFAARLQDGQIGATNVATPIVRGQP